MDADLERLRQLFSNVSQEDRECVVQFAQEMDPLGHELPGMRGAQLVERLGRGVLTEAASLEAVLAREVVRAGKLVVVRTRDLGNASLDAVTFRFERTQTIFQTIDRTKDVFFLDSSAKEVAKVTFVQNGVMITFFATKGWGESCGVNPHGNGRRLSVFVM